jgi:hypothetical protein
LGGLGPGAMERGVKNIFVAGQKVGIATIATLPPTFHKLLYIGHLFTGINYIHILLVFYNIYLLYFLGGKGGK